MTAPYTDHQEAAKAVLRRVLDGNGSLRPKEGQFLGGLSFDLNPPTERQANWLCILLEKHGLPTLAGGEA